MKLKTTRKNVMNSYSNVVNVGCCSLQGLLRYENEVAYTTRKEGWGADIYDFGDTAIVTGYAPFGNICPSYDLCKDYEAYAKEICQGHSLTWREKKEKLQEIIKEFIIEVTK